MDRDPGVWGGQGQGIWPVTGALSAMNRDLLTAPDLPEDPAEVWSGLALTTDRYKLIWEPAGDRRQAFDLGQDPSETTDISQTHQGELEPWWRALQGEWNRARGGEMSGEERERLLQRLKDLGYIQ